MTHEKKENVKGLKWQGEQFKGSDLRKTNAGYAKTSKNFKCLENLKVNQIKSRRFNYFQKIGLLDVFLKDWGDKI